MPRFSKPDTRVHDALRRIGPLPVLSGTVARIRTIADDPNGSTTDLVAVIESDEAFAANLLRYANSAANVRTINGLSMETFETNVLPILTTTCAAACHQAIGSSMSKTPIGTSFRNNRLVLTGDVKGDYGVTLTMISNACNAASNYLLSKPSTVPHPPGARNKDGTPVTVPVLPVGSANYNTIASWIATGC